nr:MAG TPA: hypothetical protein [Caudoviricetes sp.]
MYLNFNILNNEVFEMGIDDKLLEIAKRAVVRNKGLAAKGEQPCVGTIWVPDDFWKWEIAERGAYLEGLKRLGVDVLVDEGWKAKKKEDGSWDLKKYGNDQWVDL